ncbi:MAG: GtrA family protein [Micrococcaceae bacterium]
MIRSKTVGLTDIVKTIVSDKKFTFLLVGGVNTLFSMVSNILLRYLIPMSVPSGVVSAINGFFCMVIVFFAYRKFVFKVKGKILTDFVRFTTTNIVTIGFNVVMQSILADYLKYPVVPVIVGVTVIQVLLSYIGHNKFSFKRNKKGEESGYET